MNKLKELREEKKLSLRELSEKVGIIKSNLCRYELSQSEPSVSNAIKLAQFYGLTVEELFGDE